MAKDIFGDEKVNSSEDFASLFEKSVTGGLRRPSVGDAIKAEILSIGKEECFVKLNASTEGILLTQELLDKEKKISVKTGDIIDVVVVRINDGEFRVSKAGSRGASNDLDSLEDAHDMELPVEGKVLEVCNGGFRVQVMNVVAFCPVSQIDFRVSADTSAYVGKKFEFMITQLDPKKRNVVISRRKLLELERAENEGQVLDKIKPHDIVEGRVTRVEPFGAFVEIERGVEGLIHVSELSWSRVADAKAAIEVGTQVKVKVLKIEDVDGRLKISLSMKQGGDLLDPWSKVEADYPVGSNHMGTVEKKEAYGLFVNIGPGVTGLLPKSKWRDHVEGKNMENKKKGDTFLVRVDQILLGDRKISLGLPQDAEDQDWKSHSSATMSSASGLGTMADLFKGAKVKKS